MNSGMVNWCFVCVVTAKTINSKETLIKLSTYPPPPFCPCVAMLLQRLSQTHIIRFKLLSFDAYGVKVYLVELVFKGISFLLQMN